MKQALGVFAAIVWGMILGYWFRVWYGSESRVEQRYLGTVALEFWVQISISSIWGAIFLLLIARYQVGFPIVYPIFSLPAAFFHLFDRRHVGDESLSTFVFMVMFIGPMISMLGGMVLFSAAVMIWRYVL